MSRRAIVVLLMVHFAVALVITLLDYISRDMALTAELVLYTLYRCVLLMGTLLIPVLAIIRRRMDLRGLRGAAALMAAGIGCAFVAECLYFVSINVVAAMEGGPRFNVVRDALMSMTFPSFISLSLLTSTAFFIESAERHRHSQRLLESERRLSEARLALLKSQLQPHFLFNSLNSLLALVYSDPERAQLMLQRLEAFYRASADSESDAHTLANELELIRDFIDIEKIRFGDRLTASFDVDVQTLDVRLPPLLLQPLVENAITHGIGKERGAGFVGVAAERIGRTIRITVRNNAAGIARRTGVGIQNTTERLRQAYAGAAGFAFSIQAGVATATIDLPFGEAEQVSH